MTEYPTIRDRLGVIELRLSELERFSGLAVRQRQAEANQLTAKMDAIRKTPLGELKGEGEILRIAAQIAPHIKDGSDVGMVTLAINKVGLKNRAGRVFSDREVRELLSRRGFRLPVAGSDLNSRDQQVNRATAHSLLLSNSSESTEAEIDPEVVKIVHVMVETAKTQREMADARRAAPRKTLLQDLPLVKQVRSVPHPQRKTGGRPPGVQYLSDSPL